MSEMFCAVSTSHYLSTNAKQYKWNKIAVTLSAQHFHTWKWTRDKYQSKSHWLFEKAATKHRVRELPEFLKCYQATDIPRCPSRSKRPVGRPRKSSETDSGRLADTESSQQMLETLTQRVNKSQRMQRSVYWPCTAWSSSSKSLFWNKNTFPPSCIELQNPYQ